MSLLPVNFQFSKTTAITNIKIEIAQLILFESCSFNVYLYDEEKNIIEFKTFTIQDTEYKLWKEDDDYIINWIKIKLNII